MSVTINGQNHDLAKAFSLTSLLESIGLKGQPVVVELNKEAVFPRDFDSVIVNDGDSIEIITIAAGG